MTTPSRPEASRELRGHLFRMILTVAVVDVLVIALYQYLGIEGRADRVRTFFTGAWILLTLLIVLHFLGKIRATRIRARRARARS